MIDILSIVPNNDHTATKAFASIHLPGDITVHQVRVVERRNGEMFVQLPSMLDRVTGRFSPAIVLPTPIKAEVESALLGAYWKL